jgi:hypothetical protein
MDTPMGPAWPTAVPSGLSLTDAVRASCAAVADRARYVRLQSDSLPGYCDQLAIDSLIAPEIDPAHHILADAATTVAYFLTLDSINFGSGYFPTMRKRPGLSGYFTVALSLKEAFEREGGWSAERLANLSTADCAATFGQDAGFPLMALFATALNDLGRLLLARYDGDPMAVIAAADGSAERFAQLLTAMPYYRDVATYDGQEVAFYKRAQLAAADLALALAQLPAAPTAHAPNKPLGSLPSEPLFGDLDRLTIFADNLVPHVLRVDGILQYDADLLARIDAERPIPGGSAAEVEIRACAVHAVELLKAELARRGVAVTSSELDYYLWTRGGGVRYKAQPRHRSPGVYY